MIKSLKSAYFDQRESAKKDLIKIGKSTVENFIAVLKFPEPYDTRIAAAKALGEIGDPRAVEPLISALEDWQDSKFSLRTAAAEALGKIKDKKAIDALRGALENPEFLIRDVAAKGLQTINQSSSTGPSTAEDTAP